MSGPTDSRVLSGDSERPAPAPRAAAARERLGHIGGPARRDPAPADSLEMVERVGRRAAAVVSPESVSESVSVVSPESVWPGSMANSRGGRRGPARILIQATLLFLSLSSSLSLPLSLSLSPLSPFSLLSLRVSLSLLSLSPFSLSLSASHHEQPYAAK